MTRICSSLHEKQYQMLTIQQKGNDMLFKKKKEGPVVPTLSPEQFCCVIEEKSDDVSPKYCVMANANHYTLLYRNGTYEGMPQPYGGKIYPFSVDPTEKGSKRDLKEYQSAQVVCIVKDFELKVHWGTVTPFVIHDAAAHRPYHIGAHGVFYVNINAKNAGRSADRFYSKCLTNRNASLFDTEALRDFLRDTFIMEIGAAIERYITDQNRPIADFKGLTPSEILAVSKELYPTMKDIFDEYGLTVAPSSERSILEGLKVDEI